MATYNVPATDNGAWEKTLTAATVATQGVNGGLWLRRGNAVDPVTGLRVVPADTVVQHNVLSTFRESDGARAAVKEPNVLTG